MRLSVLLAIYFSLAVGYSLATPILEAGDEYWHFFAVSEIIEHRALPVLGRPADDRFSPAQEAGQPPLYHLAAALLVSWIDASDARDLWINPHADIGLPSTSPDNKNRIVHTDREAFPFRGVTLAVHMARLVSILLGGVAVYLTFRLARESAPWLPAAAPLAAAIVAFNPMFLFVSASVANDSMIASTSTLALLVLVRLVRLGLSARRLRRLSITLGLATLSKLSGLGLLPLSALVVLARSFGHGWRVVAVRLAILISGPLVLAGWWFLRNWALYGDPTGLDAWLDVAGRRTATPGLLDLLGEMQGLFMGYWGVLGAFNIVADEWVYLVYGSLCLAGLAGLALAYARSQSTARHPWAPLAVLAMWLGIEFAALVRWTQLTPASSGRLLFPAIGSVATLLAVGMVAPIEGRLRSGTALGICVVLLALAVYIPLRYVIPAYVRPMPVPASEVGQPRYPVAVDYGGKLRLLGYDLSSDQTRPGDEIAMTLYWQTLDAMDANYTVTVQVLGPEGAVGQRDVFPGQGKLATRLLRPGDSWRDTHRIRIAPDAPAPIIGRVKVGVYDYFARKALPPADPNGASLVEAIVGEVMVQPASAPPEPDAGIPVGADFGGELSLVGYEVSDRSVVAGESLQLHFYWQALRRMSRDYTVFVHLADSSGQPVAQNDSQPRQGRHPTRWWAPGEVVADLVRVAVPPEVRPGSYRLLVGVYDLSSMQRLSIAGGVDSVDLGWIEVTRPPALQGSRERSS